MFFNHCGKGFGQGDASLRADTPFAEALGLFQILKKPSGRNLLNADDARAGYQGLKNVQNGFVPGKL